MSTMSIAEREQRGRVVVATRVIEKIASQTAAEIAGTAGRDRGFLGIGGHSDASVRPKVTAEVAGQQTSLRVELGVDFPAPIGALVRQVQQRLSDQVGRMTGVAVTRVDVDVVALNSAGPNGAGLNGTGLNGAGDRSDGGRRTLK